MRKNKTNLYAIDKEVLDHPQLYFNVAVYTASGSPLSMFLL
jgi:hypothetical protein